MAMATGQLKALNRNNRDREDEDRMGRLVLARMKTLEESFADVVKEMRVLRSAVPTAQNSGDDGSWRTATSSELASSSKKTLERKIKSERSRPGSAREQRVGLGTATPRSQRSRKGKEVAGPESETEPERGNLKRRGSSF